MKKQQWKHLHNRVDSGIDARIQEKLSRQTNILEMKRQSVLKSMETKAIKAEDQRSALLSSNKKNQMIQFLKEQEAKAHSSRHEKAENYKKHELLQKLTIKDLTLREKAMEKQKQTVQREKQSKDFATERSRLGEAYFRAKMHVARETFRSSHVNSGRQSAFYTTTNTFLTENNTQPQVSQGQKPIIKSRSRNNTHGTKLNSSLAESDLPWIAGRQKGLPYFLNVTNGHFGYMKAGRRYSPNKVRQSFDASSSKEELSSISHPKNYRHSALPSNRASVNHENSALEMSMTKDIKNIEQLYLNSNASNKIPELEKQPSAADLIIIIKSCNLKKLKMLYLQEEMNQTL